VDSAQIRLLTRASQAIPLTNQWQSFYWLLDTGTPAPAWSNPIDVNDLTISYYIGISWGADGPLWISVNKYNNTGQYELVKEDARSHPETYFSGNMCSIDISLSLIGNPNSIRWVAGSSDGIVPGNIGRHDKAPETGHSTLATGAVPFGTIYIMTDGSIDPPRTPISSSDNTTYIFTNDIVSDGGIIVRRDNIKLNGAGHILRGTVADQIPGVDLNGTTNVEVENIVVREYDVGISLTYSNNCVVSGNDITASVGSYGYGIYLWHAQNSDICLNRLLGNSYGIGLDLYCTNNRFYENNMTNNGWAIVFASSDNLIYHNNFVNNGNRTSGSQQVLGWDVTNGWDDGFPSGGNYWSNYLGVDLKGGPSQNQSGSDGIGDTPFYDDRFPLMQPWVTLVGDINKDRKVSLADLVILASVYGSKLGDSNWDPNADIDGNNSIGLSDLVALAQHYGEHYP
jgi:parallel beta-helix repeat protein